MNIYERELRSLLDTLAENEILLKSVHDLEDEMALPETAVRAKNEAIKLIMNLDEAWLFVEAEGRRKGIYLVLGNSPGELVSDYHIDPTLELVLNIHFANWE